MEIVQPEDVAATREVVSATTLPLEYQYDVPQEKANIASAISVDIRSMEESELLADKTFGYASKKMYKSFKGDDFTGTDEEATQYGIDLMRRVDNNLVELGNFVNKTKDMTPDDAKVALYMMDMFEAKDFTWRGFAQGVGYMGLDPTTYIGLGTLGWGFAGKEAAKVSAKKGITTHLKNIAYSNVGIGAIEGGVYSGVVAQAKEEVSEAAGEGFDPIAVATSTAFGIGAGAVAGKYLPEIFEYAGEKIARWSEAKNFKKEVEAAAENGDDDAIQVLQDMELLDKHYGVKDFLVNKLDEFEQSKIGQITTGIQKVVPDEKTPGKKQKKPKDEEGERINASAIRGQLKFLKDKKVEPKTFKAGETSEVNRAEYEKIDLGEAKGLVGQNLQDYKTDDLWQTNFNQLENEDDVNGLIAAVSEGMKDEIMQKRGGVRKDEEIIKLAENLGTDPEFVSEFVNSTDSQFIEPEKILAARTVLNKSAAYLHDLAVTVSAGKANSEQELAFKKQFAFHQQFMGQFMAKRANVGRALRAYGLPAGIGDAQADHIQDMLNKVHGGLDVEQAAQQIAAAPDAKGIHGIVDAQDSLMKKMGNVFIENFVNSILSGVKTHIINTTGSAMMIGMHTLDTTLAARLGTAVDDVAMKVDRDEWKAGLFGMLNGTADAFSTMGQVMKTAEAYGGVTKIENNGRAYISAEYLGIEGSAGTIVDALGHIIRAPTERLMGGVDGFMKVIAERQSLAATAYRNVNAEANANEWTKEQTLKRLDELVQNPTAEMIQEANENALSVTFQTPLGEWGKTIQKAAGANPFTQFMMPFVKTPANLMKQGFLERTPLAFITDKYRNDIAAGGAKAQMAKARMYIGSAFVMSAGTLAMNGMITGAGSTNPSVKKAQMDAGWRPYSFVDTDEKGKKTYFSYQRTEPISYMFSTIADFHDTTKLQFATGVSDEKQGEVLSGSLITAISHATLDRSFMTGIEDMMDLMSNPNATKVNSFIKRFVNAQVPYSGLRRDVTRVFDDSKKMTDSIFTEIQANIPYFNSSLPNRLDSLGLPVKYDTVLNPLPVVGEKNNFILDEASRLAVAVNKNPIALPQGLMNGVRLSAQQYHDYVKLSRATDHDGFNFKSEMNEVIKSETYDEATDDQKYEMLRSITTDFNNIAKIKLFEQDEELFMKTKHRELSQAAEALKSQTGEDSKSILQRLKLQTKEAYDDAF